MHPVQLSAFDAAFLALDGPTGGGHVSLLLPFEGDATLPELRAQLAARLHLAPGLRRRLQFSKLSPNRPWWVDDPDFDLDVHLSQVHLGGAASEQTLLDSAVRYAATPLDRSRPLWAARLIRGVAGRRGAIVLLIHHSLADGVGIRDLLSLLFGTDDEPDDDAYRPQWVADAAPGELTRLSGGVADLAAWMRSMGRVDLRLLGALPGTLLRLTNGVANQLADGLERLVAGPITAGLPEPAEPLRLTPAPPTPFNARISSARAWAHTALPLATTRATRRATGTTANDLLAAATAGALRNRLRELDALPSGPLVALVPMGSSAGDGYGGGNQFTLSLVSLPTHLSTPEHRLVFAHATMNRAKVSPTLPAGVLDDLAALVGQPVTSTLTALANRLRLADLVRLPFNLMISNVPAAQQGLHVGHRALVQGVHPFPPLSDGLGLTICAQGYAGEMNVGINVCPDLLPDPARLAELLHEEYARLGELTSRSR